MPILVSNNLLSRSNSELISRLTTGMHVPRDGKRALELFLSIGEGPYPREIRAIAYSVANTATDFHSRREIMDEASAEVLGKPPYKAIQDDYASPH